MLAIQWQFLFGRRSIPFQIGYMHPSLGMMGRRYVFYTSKVGVVGLNSARSEFTISGQEISFKSMLTRRARTEIAGTMEPSIDSRSSWIPLQALLLYDSTMVLYVSTIKASGNLLFVKDPLNHYLNVDPDADLIRMIYKHGPTKPWKEVAVPIATAVKGSSFAIIRKPDTNRLVSRIYYQDPELCLRERCYDHLGTAKQWALGEQSS